MTDTSDRTSMTPADDPGWEHYSDTVLEFFADRSLVVDLSQPEPGDAVARLKEHGVGPTFPLLTACNPYGRAMDDIWNRRLTQELTVEVSAGGRFGCQPMASRGIEPIARPELLSRCRRPTPGSWRASMGNRPSSGSTAPRCGSLARWWTLRTSGCRHDR